MAFGIDLDLPDVLVRLGSNPRACLSDGGWFLGSCDDVVALRTIGDQRSVDSKQLCDLAFLSAFGCLAAFSAEHSLS